MAEFSRVPFDSLSRVSDSRLNRPGASSDASFAQLVHQRRMAFLNNGKARIDAPGDDDLDAAIRSYNDAVGEILEGLKDKIDRYSPEDLKILTPQKLILDEVDTVRCLISEASRRLENSTAMRRANEGRKLRNLMSMRDILTQSWDGNPDVKQLLSGQFISGAAFTQPMRKLHSGSPKRTK